MTDSQKQEIRELRESGCGYKSIFGISSILGRKERRLTFLSENREG